MKSKRKPQLYIIAGPNGSGKTTFARRFLPYFTDCLNFVNADSIASGLSPFSPEVVALKAGKLMLDQIHEYGKKERDFAFETTLAGRTYLKLLKDLKKKDYTVHLFYLWVRDINLAIKRIEERVRMGGHDVPASVVRRRFNRGHYNLFHVYGPLLDSWSIFDNSTELPHLIAHAKEGSLTVVDNPLYDVIRRSVRK
jgi:predicted ABC-type ATPase